ncbi:PLP-dependent transferase [Candidatus Margulisiibacteriota bacterium]
MKKIISISPRFSDKTISIIGAKYGASSLIGTENARWQPGIVARPPKQAGVNTSTWEFPTMEIGGWAFGSIPAFNPKKIKAAGMKVEYPFGGVNLYARLGLPQHQKLSSIISYLERVPGGILTPSGVSASHMAVLFNLPKNGVILKSTPIYDCTRSGFEHVYSKWGIKVPTADFSDMKKLENAIIEHKPNKLYLETPANPTMAMIDLKKVYDLAVKHNINEIIVDNTFASPVIQKPIDIVDGDPYKKIRIIHSGTKHFTGGLDGVCWGYVSLRNWDEYVPMLLFQKDMGMNMSGQDAMAVLKHGMPTLLSRVKEQSANALKAAEFLASHPLVKKVNYPGIPPFKKMADQSFTGNGYGSIIYFELDPDKLSGTTRKEKLKKSELFGDILALQSFLCLGVSLGKVNTMVENSWFMVHRFMPEDKKIKAGISPFGWRISVGSEKAEDIINELARILSLLNNEKAYQKIQKLKKQIGRPKYIDLRSN